MDVYLMQDAVARRREQFDGLNYLSDWQVHSAHITAGAISSLANGSEEGPLYVPMPTGSGKTTGAIWGIHDFVLRHPNKRLCFMTPYQASVEEVYSKLVNLLPPETVGRYHADIFGSKEDELAKQVVVLTHKFIEYNHGRLDDRDLFVIDEAIYATGEATLKFEHFAQARSWATRNGVYAGEFEQLLSLASDLNEQLKSTNKKYIAAPHIENLDWARVIVSELSLKDHSQKLDNPELMVSTQRFCEALLEGLVFLTRGNLDGQRYDPIYSAAVLGIPRIDKTVILSATGGMVYDIAGPFNQDEGSKSSWTAPTYENLTLTHLTRPEISGQYKTWSSQEKKRMVVEYVDWVLERVAEDSIYLTLPKQVLESCLRDYFDQPKTGILTYPIKAEKHGKKLFVSHHALSVGTNQFKDCKAVVYLWENHLPQAVSVQRFHTLANETITQKSLDEANSGQLVGDYQRIRNAQYIDNMMQQIGRGAVRVIDQDAKAGKMSAYVHCNSSRFERLACQYFNCSTTEMDYGIESATKPVGRIEQILSYLRTRKGHDDVSIKDVEAALGFELRRYGVQLDKNWDLNMIGYEFVAGRRGRGNTSHFKYIGDKK